MMLVPVTYKGGIHQHDIIIDLIEDLGGYIVQKHMIAQEVVLQAFVPRDDIELIARIAKPLFGEITDSPLVGTEIAVVSMSLEIHHLPHPSCDYCRVCPAHRRKDQHGQPGPGPGKRIAAINDEERDVINEHDIAVFCLRQLRDLHRAQDGPACGGGSRFRLSSAAGRTRKRSSRIINPPVDGYVGNVGRFMRRTKEADELGKLDEIVAEMTRVLEKKREEIAKDPLSVSPARLMEPDPGAGAGDPRSDLPDPADRPDGGAPGETPLRYRTRKCSGSRDRGRDHARGCCGGRPLADAGLYPREDPAVLRDKHGDMMAKKVSTQSTKDQFEEKLAQIVEKGADATAEEWMKAIEEEYGRVPLIFKRMGERPEVLISHLLYKGTVAQTSPLDPKYVELISLAVGAALKCPHCTGYHMQAALRMGAPREEILEVILSLRHDLELLGARKRVPDHR